MYLYALAQVMLLIFLLLLIKHTSDELWEHRVEKRRAHAIVHAVVLVAASIGLVLFLARHLIRLF